MERLWYSTLNWQKYLVACKQMGFEFGSGYADREIKVLDYTCVSAGAFLTGNEHNDEFFTDEYEGIRTKT